MAAGLPPGSAAAACLPLAGEPARSPPPFQTHLTSPTPAHAPCAQAAEAGFEAAYAFIGQAQEAMSDEEKAKPIKQMKPTVSRHGGGAVLVFGGVGWEAAGRAGACRYPACRASRSLGEHYVMSDETSH